MCRPLIESMDACSTKLAGISLFDINYHLGQAVPYRMMPLHLTSDSYYRSLGDRESECQEGL